MYGERSSPHKPRPQGSEFSLALASARPLPEVLMKQDKPSAPCESLHAHKNTLLSDPVAGNTKARGKSLGIGLWGLGSRMQALLGGFLIW